MIRQTVNILQTFDGQEFVLNYSVYLQTNAALANFDPVIEGQRSFTTITTQENIETSWVWKSLSIINHH